MSNINKHILLGLVYRFSGIIISFMTIPLLINYLGYEKYGIWITLLSIISWISYFDIGIGNGLRNRVTEELSKKNYTVVKEYVSTGYVIISIIASILFILLGLLIIILDWNNIFKSQIISLMDFQIFMFINFGFILLNFVASICNQILFALQKSSLVSFIKLINQVFILVLIIILIFFTNNSLIYVAFVFGFSNFITYFIFSLYIFNNYSYVTPSIKNFNRKKVKDIISLGGKFFIIQMAVLVLFTTDNIIITQLLGPHEVTKYSVVYKLFSIITIFHGMLLAPIWSAFTKYWVEKNIKEIRRILNKLNFFQIIIIISSIILVILSEPIIGLWIDPDVKIEKSLIITMGVYSIIYTWCNIYSYTLNGIGKINIQVYLAVIQALINIPLSILFVTVFNMGSAGVLLGTITSLSISAVVTPIITYKEISKE